VKCPVCLNTGTIARGDERMAVCPKCNGASNARPYRMIYIPGQRVRYSDAWLAQVRDPVGAAIALGTVLRFRAAPGTRGKELQVRVKWDDGRETWIFPKHIRQESSNGQG